MTTDPTRPSLDDLAALSALLGGDLPPDEARALRARLDAEPALAAAYEALAALPDALARLPLDIPPAALDEAVLAGPRAPAAAVVPAVPVTPSPGPLLRAPSGRSSGGVSPRAWLGWAVAAAAAVFLLVPRPLPVVTIDAGLHRVEGRVAVLAGGHRLDVDGEVEVHVEPTGALARGHGAEAVMNRTSVAAAGFGALVTVAVLEGSAILHGDDGSVESLRAGDTRRFGEEPTRGGPSRAVASRSGPSDVPSASPAELAAEVERLRLENALLRGQIVGLQGVPQPWPASLPDGYRAEGFEARARALVGDVAGVQLARVDCDEYPCIAVYRLADPTQPIDDVLRQPLDDSYGKDANIMVWGVRSVDDNGASYSLAAVAVTPDEDADDVDALRTRVNTRVEPLVHELATVDDPE